MRKLLISSLMIILTATTVIAAEKKKLKDINQNELYKEVQIQPQGSGDDQINFVLWLPREYWASIFARDTTTSKTTKETMLNIMSNVSIFVVVQVETTNIGSIQFYSKEEIAKNMIISVIDRNGNKQKLKLLKDIHPNLQLVLNSFKPILSNSMGDLGQNFHFYVFENKNKDNRRKLDPYEEGTMNIQLANRNGEVMNGKIKMPLNSLFVPRICPNGEPAHISWNYCPWSGQKLKN